MEHRGGTGLEKNTGDGAGILFQVPHHFFRKEAQKCGQILPAEGDYGVAMLFFPQDDKGVEDARRVFEEGCAEAGVPLLLALSDAWAPIRGNLENQDSKTALSAQLKLEGIGLFGRMTALRQGMGA